MIRLTVVSYNNIAPENAWSVLFPQGSQTLGRGEDNHLVLPDPRQIVSRVQAAIICDGTRHSIVNLSQATPILINGRQIDSDQEMLLLVGDEIRIGLYLLRAEAHLTAIDSVAEGDEMSEQAELAEMAEMAEMAELGELDKGGEMAEPADSAVAPMSLSLVPNGPTPEPSCAVAPMNLSLVANVPTPEPGCAVAPKNLSLVPNVTTPAPGIAAQEEPASTSPAKLDESALIQAFLNGAGISAHTPQPVLTAEFMELLGKLLATAVNGTVHLSSLRALVKREANADLTMMVVRNNNPIKFFRDGETVLNQMLRKKMPGFMGPVEAMEDAFQDLHAHQLGVVAGMRAALANILARVHPERLAKKLAAPSLLDSMFPIARKARMWDMYAVRFQQISKDSQGNAHSPFGEPFVRAYEQEIERIRSDKFDDERP